MRPASLYANRQMSFDMYASMFGRDVSARLCFSRWLAEQVIIEDEGKMAAQQNVGSADQGVAAGGAPKRSKRSGRKR